MTHKLTALALFLFIGGALGLWVSAVMADTTIATHESSLIIYHSDL